METEATPLIEVVEHFRYSGRRTPQQREMDWTQAQHLQRGWVSARVPAHFQMRKSETRRERLQLENAGGQLSAVNGLGAVISSLCVVDDAGSTYAAFNIPAGQKVALTTCTEPPASDARLGKLWDTLHQQLPESLRPADGIMRLPPGTYVAELETNPFLENALGPKATSARTRAHCFVYGLLEPAPHP
jgi:hypothetical protein